MTGADRLAWLAYGYGVDVALADAHRLAVTGPANIVRAAIPSLRAHRDELVAHLRSLTDCEVTP